MLEAGGGGAPIAIDLDEELEENLLLEEILDILAGLRADALKGRAGFADEDTFLGIAFTVDNGGNLNEISIGHW